MAASMACLACAPRCSSASLCRAHPHAFIATPISPSSAQFAPSPLALLTSAFGPRGAAIAVGSHARAHQTSSVLQEMEFDVVVVGAGIIGLTVANRILVETSFSVVVVDAKRPCAGATGAGQGYIWLNHRNPASKTWGLALRSKILWERLVADLADAGSDPLSAIGWQNTGSLLVANSAEEARGLQAHVEAMATAGVDAEFLIPSKLQKVEPSLKVGHEGGAAFVREDSQIDAALAVEFVRKRNLAYRVQGRYMELFDSPVEELYRSSADGSIEAVLTSSHRLRGREAVVVAAGAWSPNILTRAAQEWRLPLVPSVKPRKGHLLVLKGLSSLKINHGLMEFEYTANCTTALNTQGSQPEEVPTPSLSIDPIVIPHDTLRIAMTASTDKSGRLLLGSSREFSGFSTAHDYEAIEGILSRASEFLPALKDISVEDVLERQTVRTGLRPYVFGGVPLIGPVPGVEGLMLATGHEGSGLCMALGTAEMLVTLLLGKETTFDVDPYLPSSRLCHP